MAPESADALIGAYSETSGISAQQYARAVELGYLYGAAGIQMEHISQATEFWDLSESQRRLAYELGATVRAEKDAAREADIERQKRVAREKAKKSAIVIEADSELADRIRSSSKSKYAVIRDYLVEKLGGKEFRLSDGRRAIMDKRDAQELSHKANSTRIAQLGNLKEIVENAIYSHGEDNIDHNKFSAFYYYTVDVTYDGKTFPLWINVGVAKNDGTNHIYAITNRTEEAPTNYGVSRPVGDAIQNASSNDSIPQTGEKINTFSENNSKEAKAEAMRDAKEALTRTNDENMQVTDNSEEHTISEREKITVGMSEGERADVLRNKRISPAPISKDADLDIDSEALETKDWEIAKKLKKPIVQKLRELGFLKNYRTEAIDVDFEFTGNGALKSANSQILDYGGSLGDFAKVVMNLQAILDRAVLLEIHTDKAVGTSKENSRLLQTYVLLGAFQEGNFCTPVQFEIKQYTDNKNRLYLAVALTKIETGVVSDTAPQEEGRTRLLPVSDYSIAELIQKVNTADENFFKYIPEEFLTPEQIEAKHRALAKEAKKYGKETPSQAVSKTEKTTRKEGTVTVKADESTLSERQKVSVECLRSLAKAIGVNFVVEKLSTRTRMGRVGENGRFDRKTNTVYLDLNAGNDGEGVILYTASHELTHFIAKWSPKKYKILRETLFDFYGKTNKDVIAMAREQMAAAKEAGHPITFDAAIEEVVADAMERMLTDGNAQKILTEIEKKDKSLFEKIKSYFAELLAKIRKAYEGAAFQSDEAQFLHESAEAVERVQALFFDALSDASETYREIGNGKENSQMSVDSESFSVRRSEQDSEISNADVELVRSIGEVRGRISINNFTSEEIQKAEKWARKFYAELGTKSPFFRAWFGDWRARDATPLKIANIDKNAKPSSGNTINKDTGRKFSWSTEVAKESIINSPKAYKSDISYISANINLVVENAVLLDTVISSHKSKRKLPGSTWMHSLYSLVDIDGKISLIKLFAEEAYSAKSNDTFTRAYSLKYIEKVAEIDRGVHSENGGLTDSHSTTVYSISDLFDFVKRYDTEFSPKSVNPSMLNPDGTPKVVYHQTGARFSIFNTDNPVAGLNDSETPNGIFFKDNDHDIGLQGKMQMAVYLNARSILHFANREEANRWYRKNVDGYDALHKEYDRAMEAFNPRFAEIEKEQFDPSTTDERQDELDQMEDELIAELSKVENDYRIRLRERLNDYFLDGKSGYDCIELDYDGHRWVGGKRENVHTYIVFDKKKIKSATDNIGTFDGSNPDIRYSVRKSNRSTLTAALDSVVTDPEERRILDVYRANIENLDAQQERLQELNAEIKLLSFSDGVKDRATLLGYITRLAQRMKGLKLGTYQNATQDQSK